MRKKGGGGCCFCLSLIFTANTCSSNSHLFSWWITCSNNMAAKMWITFTESLKYCVWARWLFFERSLTLMTFLRGVVMGLTHAWRALRHTLQQHGNTQSGTCLLIDATPIPSVLCICVFVCVCMCVCVWWVGVCVCACVCSSPHSFCSCHTPHFPNSWHRM